MTFGVLRLDGALEFWRSLFSSFPSSSLGTHTTKLLLGVANRPRSRNPRSWSFKDDVPKPELGNENKSRIHRKERGIWQRRFWEHTLEDEHDFERHFDGIHDNPVKHGWAKSPANWPYSSFHRWIGRGVSDKSWGRRELRFDDLDQSPME